MAANSNLMWRRDVFGTLLMIQGTAGRIGLTAAAFKSKFCRHLANVDGGPVNSSASNLPICVDSVSTGFLFRVALADMNHFRHKNTRLGDSMRRLCCVFFLLVCCAAAVDRRPLKIASDVAIQQLDAVVLSGPFKCDMDGNVYLRPYDPTGSTSVLRISPDGKQLVRFQISTGGFGNEAFVIDFYSALGREMYLIVGTDKLEYFIVRFNGSGEFISKSRIDEGYEPRQLVVLPSGDLLLAGIMGNSSKDRRPFVGIFNDRGQFLRLGTSTLSSNIKSNSISFDMRKMVDLSVAVAAEDGFIYLMRYGQEGKILVLSATGQVTDELKLEVPEGAVLDDIKISKRRLAAIFRRSPDRGKGEKFFQLTVAVYDLFSHEKVAEYFNTSASLGYAVACYSPEVLTFVGTTPSGKLSLVTAEPAH